MLKSIFIALSVWVVTAATGPGLVSAQDGGRRPSADARAEVVPFQWPDHPKQREILVYLSSSLLPVKPTPVRPTLEERLGQAPFITGQGRVGLDLSTLDAEAAAALRTAATSPDSSALLTWTNMPPVAEKLYGPRRAPTLLAALYQTLSFPAHPRWSSVDVMSAISGNRRRLWFDLQTVLDVALTSLEKNQPPVFPPGSTFMAEHFDGIGKVVETHVLSRRVDHEWDYFLYDAAGAIAPVSHEMGMRSPTTCFACHHNAPRLPPFRDFPEASPPMANGFQTSVLVTLTEAQREVVRAFGTHSPRPQEMQGHYGGLAALRLRAMLTEGAAPDWAAPLWKRVLRSVPAAAALP